MPFMMKCTSWLLLNWWWYHLPSSLRVDSTADWGRSARRLNNRLRNLGGGVLSLFGRGPVLFTYFIKNLNIFLSGGRLLPVFTGKAVVNDKSRLVHVQMMSWRNLLLLNLNMLLETYLVGSLLNWTLSRIRNIVLALCFLSGNSSLLEILVFFTNLLIKRFFTRS